MNAHKVEDFVPGAGIDDDLAIKPIPDIQAHFWIDVRGCVGIALDLFPTQQKAKRKVLGWMRDRDIVAYRISTNRVHAVGSDDDIGLILFTVGEVDHAFLRVYTLDLGGTQ